MNSREIIQIVEPIKKYGQLDELELGSISQDTRTVQKNSCFVCIEGAQVDGHLFVAQAVKNGAVLIIAEKAIDSTVPYLLVQNSKKAFAQLSAAFCGDPTKELAIIGVTGTNGKTTTTHLIEEVLRNSGKPTGIIGTMYNKIGAKKIPTINTTPDSLTIQKLLKQMKDSAIEACAIEVSSHALFQGRVWGVDFDVAVFTNLSQDHLEYHHTMTDYFYAKSLLFSQLGNSYHDDQKKKTAVINIDDAYGRKLLPLTSANVVTYGIQNSATIQALDVKVTSKGTQFTLAFLDEVYPVTMKLIGDFNVYNVLAAVGSCHALGVKTEVIIRAIEQIKGVRGRFELVPNEQEITVIVDYAHTPDGLENVLKTARKFAEKDVYCVIGCGGDRDPGKRSVMGKIAVEYATHAMFTSDNPRTEDPEVILDQMTEQLVAASYQRETDRKKAIETVLAQAKTGDVVLIAGKGHEDYQIIGKEKHPFDDVTVVKNYFRQIN